MERKSVCDKFLWARSSRWWKNDAAKFGNTKSSKKLLTKISTERDPEHRVLSRAEPPPRSVVSKCLAIMANPRKFSEKIALHTHRQAEETARFEQIMKEVSDATARVRNNHL